MTQRKSDGGSEHLRRRRVEVVLAAPPLRHPPSLTVRTPTQTQGFNWDLFGGEPERVKVEREANLADFPEDVRCRALSVFR